VLLGIQIARGRILDAAPHGGRSMANTECKKSRASIHGRRTVHVLPVRPLIICGIRTLPN
jgi:hypothetical protein